jgi:hypothetical protein
MIETQEMTPKDLETQIEAPFDTSTWFDLAIKTCAVFVMVGFFVVLILPIMHKH